MEYTKLLQFKIILVFKDSSGNITISIKDKEYMMQKTVVFLPPQSILKKPKIPIDIAYTMITKELVRKVFMAQLT